MHLVTSSFLLLVVRCLVTSSDALVTLLKVLLFFTKRHLFVHAGGREAGTSPRQGSINSSIEPAAPILCHVESQALNPSHFTFQLNCEWHKDFNSCPKSTKYTTHLFALENLAEAFKKPTTRDGQELGYNIS